MAKKENPRERRERELVEKQAKFRAAEEQRRNAEKEKQLEAQRREEAAKAAAEDRMWAGLAEDMKKQTDPDEEPKKKSSAKAAGLKSTFVLSGDELLMTSFGKGNRATPEKRILAREVQPLNDPPAFQAEAKPQKPVYEISGRGVTAEVADPLWEQTSARQDLIGCKSELEKRYFGQEFGDNVHIQLIYNLLDMEKHLAVQVNNMVYSLNNVLGSGTDEDMFMSLNLGEPYDGAAAKKYGELIQSILNNRRIGYFGSAFCKPNLSKDGKQQKALPRSEEEVYYILCLLGGIRQSMAHDKAKEIYNSPWLLDGTYDAKFTANQGIAHRMARKVMDGLYAEQVQKLNRDFLEHAKADLAILFHAMDANSDEEQKAIARDYYLFIVRKDQKNMGFSLKKLRETILLGPGKEFTGTNYDELRSRLYRAFDLMAFRYFKEKPERADAIVEGLRASRNALEKAQVYGRASRELWKAVGSRFSEKVAPRLKGSGDKIKELKKEVTVRTEWLDGVLVPEHASAFSELMYLLTMFQDGKEINILLTGLINKLENVQSFLDVMQESGLECTFQKEYELFARSGELAQELRVVLSFARMEKPDPGAKREMFVDASRILGDESSREELISYWDEHLAVGKGMDHTLRNFISSNVISSDRFRYLVRYLDPERARKLASCRPLVEFALKDIPEAQIVRYINGTEGRKLTEADYEDRMRQRLAERITGMRFAEFTKVRKDDPEDRQQKAAIIGLYLTVLYLIVKNLIYVNTRYFIAFHAWERDKNLMKQKKEICGGRNMKQLEFAAAWLKYRTGQRNQRAWNYLNQNLENADQKTIQNFRNQTAHLTPIRNAERYAGDIASVRSWFSLYHYLMQRTIMEEVSAEPGSKTAEYFDKVTKYHCFCKDFLKALCIPFCYNLARYKALCIEELFDKNIPLQKGTKAPTEAPTDE